MTFTSGDIAIVFSAIAGLIAAYAAYKNSTRKAELERLQARVSDTEQRLADAEKRANANEQRAIDYRKDVIRIGEQIEAERHESMRRLAMVAEDGNQKINKVVLVLEQVLVDFEAATGRKAEIDIAALKRLVVIDHITGPMGPLDVHAVERIRDEK